MRGCPRPPAVAGVLLLLSLLWPSSSGAITVSSELLVSVNGFFVGSAFGGPDAASNTPLLVDVVPGDQVDVAVLISFGLPMRQYETTITADDPLSLDYVPGSAMDISTLGFSALADPDATLQDGTPGSGPADSELCPVATCVAPSSNALYELSWTVQAGFPLDALRDVTISIDSILFDDPGNSLDPNQDTASLRLVPEPGSFGLVLLGLGALAAGRSRR